MRDSVNLKYSFFYFAAFVVIIAGIKLASQIVIILLLSIFISSIFLALLRYLSSFSIPKIASYFIITSIFIFIIFLFFYIVSNSLNRFLQHLPEYEQNLRVVILQFIEFIDIYNIKFDKNEILKILDFSAIFSFTTNLLSNLGVIFSKMLLVFIGVAFILYEADSFHKKLESYANNSAIRLQNFKLFSTNIQKYFIIKSFTSFLTGFLIFIVLIFFDVEYPLLWAVVAFLFNFIPVIGSIVAAIPAILLTLFKGNLEIALYLSVIYIVINISISNILEPKFMGDGLGLSATVIFFSLIFWGYVLGLAGMFLAVPITMTIKIASEATNSTKWLGLLLSKS